MNLLFQIKMFKYKKHPMYLCKKEIY